MKFEELMQKLTEITNKLEDKETTIEQSFLLFEEGLKISQQCEAILNDFTNRLDQLKTNYEIIQKRIDDNE